MNPIISSLNSQIASLSSQLETDMFLSKARRDALIEALDKLVAQRQMALDTLKPKSEPPAVGVFFSSINWR